MGRWPHARKNPEMGNSQGLQPRTRRILFSRIAALQIVAKWACVSGRPEKYEAYELNLVLADHSRFNLVDHRDRSPIEQDARLLAEVLNVPVVK